ncbi:UDP-glycosyltransferase 87A1-like [Actinidia eriantha]|uniref:UDP-glycosyltransferase 87A1-like n=1 Tax=Actinidia eriantha TaxID=165200 RepID=UPI00258B66DB|nr:UDP-glycosyltransferase 87A1-like [Actinidia eriantha]
MESVHADPTISFHVVAMPYPGRGHINPMMNLCKLLVSRNGRIAITFVVTEEWLGILGSEPKPANVRFATVPNVIPSEIGRGADFPNFFEAVMTKLQEPFEQLLDRLEPSVIVYDTFLAWMVGVGNRRNIPMASLWTTQAAEFPVNLSEKGNEQIDGIPGIPDNGLKIVHRILEAISLVPKTQYLLLTSIYELESHTIDALRNIVPIPIYSIGPAIPYFNLKDNDNDNDNDYVQWLNSQPKSSVLYVSQGSFLSVSKAQMDEIIIGVKNSGVRFLWVARGEASRIKELCGSDEGVVVPWCDQLKVLCHPSIGGFWSHCGWNSTKEGIFAGVPFLTYPILADQIPNSKTIVEDWKIGWEVRRGIEMEEQLVTREEIAGLVRRVMDLESEEGKEMRKRAKELREICRRATSEGGSVETEIDAFIRDISLSYNH